MFFYLGNLIMQNLSTGFSFSFPLSDYNRKLEVNIMILILFLILFFICYSGCVISSKCSRKEEKAETLKKNKLV